LNNILLLDRELHLWLDKQHSSSKLHVIISPSFYIAKISTIPFQNISQARQVEASIFDGFLPSGKFCFETHVLDAKLHLFLAIDYEGVLLRLQSMGLDYKKIIFHTTQSAFKSYKMPLLLQEGMAVVDEGGVLLLSKSVDNGKAYTKIDPSLLGLSNRIFFKEDSKVGLRAQKLFLVSLSLFAALFFVDLVVKAVKIFGISSEISAIRANENIPHTNIELQSSLKNLTATDEKQKNIRALLNHLLSYGFLDGEYVKSIKISQNTFEIEIGTQRGDELKKFISQKFKIEGSVISSDSLYIKALM
jgi:hypothetical protein